MRAVPGLAVCDEATLLAIVGSSFNLHWPAGVRVFERGSPADGLFIVLIGVVRILAEDDVEVASLGPGQYFGELALLLGAPHRYDAVAAEDVDLMVVPKDRFDALLAESPGLAEAVRKTAAERAGTDFGGPPPAWTMAR
ncbi:MAG: cyclic nucleotide-binding domain-containing protein [Actinobacteria bacterium]|nr:cyclic nucleotide-binding domain-containing protein [Actinomycetota bacterium]